MIAGYLMRQIPLSTADNHPVTETCVARERFPHKKRFLVEAAFQGGGKIHQIIEGREGSDEVQVVSLPG